MFNSIILNIYFDTLNMKCLVIILLNFHYYYSMKFTYKFFLKKYQIFFIKGFLIDEVDFCFQLLLNNGIIHVLSTLVMERKML